MNHSTTSFAMARRNQWIKLGFLVAQANFTVALSLLKCLVMLILVLFHLKNPICFLKMISLSQSECLILIFRLNDQIFNPSQLDYVARPYIAWKIRRGYPTLVPFLLNSLTTKYGVRYKCGVYGTKVFYFAMWDFNLNSGIPFDLSITTSTTKELLWLSWCFPFESKI